MIRDVNIIADVFTYSDGYDGNYREKRNEKVYISVFTISDFLSNYLKK